MLDGEKLHEIHRNPAQLHGKNTKKHTSNECIDFRRISGPANLDLRAPGSPGTTISESASRRRSGLKKWLIDVGWSMFSWLISWKIPELEDEPGLDPYFRKPPW